MHRYKKVVTMKELHNIFDKMYLGVWNIIITDEFFIITNVRIYCQMDAAEFERLLYTILFQETSNNQRICIKEKNDDYTISDYVSHNFGILIG